MAVRASVFRVVMTFSMVLELVMTLELAIS